MKRYVYCCPGFLEWILAETRSVPKPQQDSCKCLPSQVTKRWHCAVRNFDSHSTYMDSQDLLWSCFLSPHTGTHPSKADKVLCIYQTAAAWLRTLLNWQLKLIHLCIVVYLWQIVDCIYINRQRAKCSTSFFFKVTSFCNRNVLPFGLYQGWMMVVERGAPFSVLSAARNFSVSFLSEKDWISSISLFS